MIEQAIKQNPIVGEAVVIGDRRKYLSVLVTLDPEAIAKFLSQRGITTDTPWNHPEVRAEIQRQVDLVNQDLARVEQVAQPCNMCDG